MLWDQLQDLAYEVFIPAVVTAWLLLRSWLARRRDREQRRIWRARKRKDSRT